MAIEYVNRRGETYYLLQGVTKAGKPTYYASRKAKGVLAAALPEEFEFREDPERAIVTVRRIKPSKVTPLEREQLTEWTRELSELTHVIVDIDEKSLIVYTPNNSPQDMWDTINSLYLGPARGRDASYDWLARRGSYSAMLRFTLVDEKRRLFEVDRWCFRGSIDSWFPLAPGKPLEVQARKFLPHVAKESFFELM